jgi:hypothetical protein
MRHSETPYWNFWRVIFAGWLIRFPGLLRVPIVLFFGTILMVLLNKNGN